MTFYRIGHKGAYEITRSLEMPLGTNRDKFVAYERSRSNFDYILDIASRSDESFSRLISDNVAVEDLDDFVNASAFFWELFYDKVRARHFAETHSRSDVVFVFTSISDAENFMETCLVESKTPGNRRRFRKEDQVIYEVIPEIPQEVSSFDMKILDDLNSGLNYTRAEQLIFAYWSGKRSKNPLLESMLRGCCHAGDVVRVRLRMIMDERCGGA